MIKNDLYALIEGIEKCYAWVGPNGDNKHLLTREEVDLLYLKEKIKKKTKPRIDVNPRRLR